MTHKTLGGRSRTGLRTAVIAVLALVAGLVTIAAPSYAAGTGTITGQAVSSAGGPADNVYVVATVYTAEGDNLEFSSRTDTTGAYTISNVPAGDAEVCFQYGDPDVRDLDQHFAGNCVSDILTVTDGETTAAPSVTLLRVSSVIGSVTNADGTPYQGQVELFTFQSDGAGGHTWSNVNNEGNTYGFANNGRWSVPFVEPGTYRVCFDEAQKGSSCLGADWVENGTAVTIGATRKTGVNAVLGAPGTVAGTVTGPNTNPAFAQVNIYRQAPDHHGHLAWVSAGKTTTRSNGAYTITRPSGTYRVGFRPPSDSGLREEYFDDKARLADAFSLEAPDNGTFEANAQLESGASVSGTVTFPTRNEVATVAVVDVATGKTVRKAYVDPTAPDYSIDGLAAGSYRVEFNHLSGYEIGSVGQYYDNVAEVNGPAAATLLDLAGTDTRTGVNATLTRGAIIRGSIAPGPGLSFEGLAETPVVAESTTGDMSARQGQIDGTTGAFSIRGLSPGSYRITFGPPGEFPLWLNSSNAFTPSSTNAMVVTVGATTVKTLTSGSSVEFSDSFDYLQNTSAPTVSGSPNVGQTLTADPGTWSAAGAAYTYQWLADGKPISGATSSTYVPKSTDVGKRVAVRVTAVKDGFYDGVAASDDTADVGQTPPIANSVAPSIGGTPTIGSALTVNTGAWSPTPSSFGYQWLANDVAIGGATGSTYTVVSGDLGKQISVRVTASKAGYADGTATSAKTAAVSKQDIVNNAVPTITGTPGVGSTLTAQPGSWTPSAGLTFGYQWLAAGTPVSGATASTYAPSSDQVGKKISVIVTASKSDYNSASKTSAETTAVPAPVVTTVSVPTISGIARTGDTLTATPGTWSPNDGLTYAYQWLANGTPISGATASTYKVTATELTKKMSVKVTASRSGYTGGTATSAPTAAVYRTVITNSVAPKITGSAAVGKVLTAVPGTWNPSDSTYAYQWYVGTTAISGASGQTYTIPASKLGKQIRVKVTASRSGATSVAKYSPNTVAVGKGTITVTTPPSITGTAQVGKVLTAVPGVTEQTTTKTYQWLRTGVAISGATASTYTLKSTDKGKQLSVKVTYHKTAYNPRSVTTEKTAVVTAAAVALIGLGQGR
jgi:hypothetical protein